MENETIKLLFVEDNKTDQMSFQRFVKENHLFYNCTIAESVNVAKSELGKNIFDIVLTDYDLGDGTAFDLIKCIPDHIPFVVITGAGNEEIAVDAMKAGATDYLIKDPYGYYLKTLPITVENAIRVKSSEIALKKYKKNLEKMVDDRTMQLNATVKRLNSEIKERIRVEKSLKEKEKFFENTLNDMNTMIIVMEPDGKIKFVNNTFLTSLKQSSDNIINNKLYKCDLWNYKKGMRSSIHEDIEKCASGETSIRQIQVQTVEEVLLWLDFGIHPVYNENKEITFLIGECRDITDKIIIEEQLRQSNKMEAIGTLAGGIAHDFNNILTAINGYAELAMFSMQKSDPVYNKLDKICKVGKRAANLTKQILAFSRKQIYEPKIISVNSLLKEMDQMLQRIVGEDIELEFILEEKLPYIKADPTQVEQIIMNLVVNGKGALDARKQKTENGKIIVETRSVPSNDLFVASLHDFKGIPCIMITVKDTGIGMDDKVKSRIFDPFFTTKEKNKGVGLGLSTVFGIIKQNKAFITVESVVGIGSKFKILWPVSEKKQPVLTEKKQIENSPAGIETILLVEDDETVRNLTASLLKHLNYKVVEAINGIDALDKVQKKLAFDILITDVKMPQMSGAQLVLEVKKIYPSVKVLFISGYMNGYIGENGKLQEDINFLSKPFTKNELGCKVRSILDCP